MIYRCVSCGFEDTQPLRDGVNNHWRKGYVPGLRPTSREAICYAELKPVSAAPTQAEQPTPRTEAFKLAVSPLIIAFEKLERENSALRAENDGLHTAICQAVGLHNQGEPTGAAQILRQALIAYADAAMQEGKKS